MSWMVRKNRELADPFLGLWDVQRELSRLFSSSGIGVWPHDGGAVLEGAWAMPLDVYETKDQVVVKAELPGLKPEDINVSVLDNTLTIKAERKQEAEVNDEHVYRRELAYGIFQRQLELPQAVNTDGLKAGYTNGILEITLPKREEAKPKQVRVQAQ